MEINEKLNRKIGFNQTVLIFITGLAGIIFIVTQFFGSQTVSLINRFTSRSATINPPLINPVNPAHPAFSLQFPDSWQGKYEQRQSGSITTYVYAGSAGKKPALFQIAALSKTRYDQESQQPGYHGQLVAESGNFAFVLFRPPVNLSIDEAVNSDYQALADQIDQVVATLSIQ